MGWRRDAAHPEGTSLTLSDLLDMCRRLGLEVETRRLPSGFLGAYDHRRQRILLDHGLTPVEQRCVLAHELGHATLMHDGCSPAFERAAERFAARVLIDPGALRAACAWARNDAELAEELGVTADIIAAYREHHDAAHAA